MPTVLIIEDEVVLRSSMARGLRKLKGIETLEAGTLSRAVQFLDESSVDLIFSDIDLPDRSGLEILGELGKRSLRIPIVFISAYLKAYAPQIPIHAGIEVYDKPVSLDDLRQIVVNKVGSSYQQDDVPFSVCDYIQIACLGQHSISITLTSDLSVSLIQIVSGKVWYAKDKEGVGPEAFYRLVFSKQEKISCSTLQGEPKERNIFGSWEELLMEAARIKDENEHNNDFLDLYPEESPSSLTNANTVETPKVLEIPPPDEFENIWDKAINALLSKDYLQALDLFLQAKQVRPTDPRVTANLARLEAMGYRQEEKV